MIAETNHADQMSTSMSFFVLVFFSFFFIVCRCSFDTSRCWKSLDFSIFSLRCVSILFFLIFFDSDTICAEHQEKNCVCVEQINCLFDGEKRFPLGFD